MLAVSCTQGSDATSTSGSAPESTTTIPLTEFTTIGEVSAVVNGDTVQLDVGNEQLVVRLQGVWAPHGEQCYAAEAASILASIAGGQSVGVVGETDDADGTPLRYLIIDAEVPVLINLELVAAGGAAALHGHDLAGDFLRVNERAYASGKGMWGTFVCGQPEGSVAPDRPQIRIDQLIPPGGGEAGSVVVINQSYTQVDIGGWTISEVGMPTTFAFADGSTVPPGELIRPAVQCTGPAVCVRDELWTAGGTLLLRDALGNVVDRFVYEP